ncbi:alpha-amylase [Streptomyces sp. NBC_00344]|uniref:alpha-amylase n=1 Tax=Streptomyces sp. NBC_00344 TaxID=2975720 RepID=UPI002E218ECF
MQSALRSTVRALALGLSMVTAGLAQSAEAAGGDAEGQAPGCVQYATSWRYTFVTNSCDSTQLLAVDYLHGDEVPCRIAAPGDTVTFPGYGTDGNQVLGVRLCLDPAS